MKKLCDPTIEKIFAVVIMLLMLFGCTGLKPNTLVTKVGDIGFYYMLKNNPTYKAKVVSGIAEIKTYLNGTVTYLDLINEVSAVFPNEYSDIAKIIINDFSSDSPILTTTIPLLDSYKQGVIAELDRILLLTK
jgi:hypothetical protein